MVLPDHIVQAAKDGDIAVVEAFLDAEPGAINDRDEEWDLTLLMASMNSSITERHVWFARRLIARGADVNIGNIEDKLPLHYACYPGDCSSTMVSLLLASGARVNARTDEDEDLTPLGQLIEEFDYNLWKNEEAENRRRISRSGLEIMKLLLKAGASVDRCQGGLSAEAAMQGFLSRRPNYANDESFTKCRELVAGVRAHGSYKAYVREPHRQFLRMRSLLVRGRAKTKDRRLERIARLPNGACWHVLSYLWEAA